jgi:hypothetical protein
MGMGEGASSGLGGDQWRAVVNTAVKLWVP